MTHALSFETSDRHLIGYFSERYLNLLPHAPAWAQILVIEGDLDTYLDGETLGLQDAGNYGECDADDGEVDVYIDRHRRAEHVIVTKVHEWSHVFDAMLKSSALRPWSHNTTWGRVVRHQVAISKHDKTRFARTRTLYPGAEDLLVQLRKHKQDPYWLKQEEALVEMVCHFLMLCDKLRGDQTEAGRRLNCAYPELWPVLEKKFIPAAEKKAAELLAGSGRASRRARFGPFTVGDRTA